MAKERLKKPLPPPAPPKAVILPCECRISQWTWICWKCGRCISHCLHKEFVKIRSNEVKGLTTS